MEYNGQLVNPDATFEMLAATNILNAACYVACTNIIVSNASKKRTHLKIRSASVINPEATLHIVNSATVEVEGNISVHLKGLVINGESKGKGAYSAQNCPGIISGAGRLRVGAAGFGIFVR